MNKEELAKYNQLIVDKYDTSRHEGAIDCVMPGFFNGNDVMFIGQNPGLLKEDVEGDMLYLRAYRNKEYDKLNGHYVDALKSNRGTYGTFINDIYGEDWSNISITNVFKCPFVDNKIPDTIPEREKKILRKQIEFVNPKVIVAVGRVAFIFTIHEDWSIKERMIHTDHPSFLKRYGKESYDKELTRYRAELHRALTNKHEATE